MGGMESSSTLSLTSDLEEVSGQRHVPAVLPREMTRYPLHRMLGEHPCPVWTGAENLASTGIRFADLLARSESIYRLSYGGPVGTQGKSEKLRLDWPVY
jgi:hypothetical protein